MDELEMGGDRRDRQRGVPAAASAVSVELQVQGMTCCACSGTIESTLQKLTSVERATVSLLLSRAYVICDPAQLSPEELKEEIEDVGFDATVISVTAATEAAPGRAALHLRVLGDLSRNGGPGGGGRGGGHRREEDVEEAAASASAMSAAVSAAPDDARVIKGLPGVLDCQTTSEGHKSVHYDPHAVGARQLLERIRAEGLAVEWVKVRTEGEQLQGSFRELAALRCDLARAAPPAVAVFVLAILLPSFGIQHGVMGLLSTRIHHGLDALSVIVFLLATPVQFVVAYRFHVAAYKALQRRFPNMDVLVSVATSTSYFYSTSLMLYCLATPETSGRHALVRATVHFLTMGPILVAVVLFGKFLEAHAKLKAMQAVTDLPSTQPDTAIVCMEGGGESEVPVELVELGDVLRVFAGSKVPVDGTLCSETAVHVDESLLTGESTPVCKKQGDGVLGGSTCVSGGCLMRVSKVGCDTMLGQMVQLVQDAQASKAAVQRTADKVARVFVPSVVCLSVLTFTIWSIAVFGGFVQVPSSDMSLSHRMQMQSDATPDVENSLKLLFAMKFGMAVLMIACPCAMGLATPMAIMVATGMAAKRGCLVKTAAALETSASLDAIVLDKTGTITQGAPAIRAAACISESFDIVSNSWGASFKPLHVQSMEDSPVIAPLDIIGSPATGMANEIQRCFWWLLASLESASDHPIAKCIQNTAQQIPELPAIIAPSDFEYISGRGIRGLVKQLGGVEARIGNLRFYEESVPAGPQVPGAAELHEWVDRYQKAGHTVVLMHLDGQPFGAVALQDPVREDAEWVVRYMHHVLGAEVWLCTGDNAATAQSIAQEVGISKVVAEALPSTKAECVQQLRRQGKRRVGFVGDGVNDSPALAQADVGIAIGVGAQIAVDSADVVLVRAELQDCVAFLALSRATLRTIGLNFFWAFCFNFVCLPVAAGVFYPRAYIPPLVAGIGMACSSTFVIVSSLLLRCFQPPTKKQVVAGLRPRIPFAHLCHRGRERVRSDEEDMVDVPFTSSVAVEISDPTPDVIGQERCRGS